MKDVAIAVVNGQGTATAFRLTNRSGKLDQVIAIPVPDREESLSPNPGEVPYTTVNLFARKESYEQIDAYGIQIFADTLTQQNLEFIPESEFFDDQIPEEIFVTPPQNL